MSAEKHQAAVRKNLSDLQTGDKRAFFYAFEADRHVLHVSKEDGSSARFGDLSKVNQYLKKKKYGDPLGDSAKLCAGKVILTGDNVLFFAVKVKKGATPGDLMKGAKKLKAALKLKKIRIGEPGEDNDAPGGTEQPKGSGARENARDASAKMEERISRLRTDVAAVLSDTTAPASALQGPLERLRRALEVIDDDALEALLPQLEAEHRERARREAEASALQQLGQQLIRVPPGERSFAPVEDFDRRSQALLGLSGYRPALLSDLEKTRFALRRRIRKLEELRTQYAELRIAGQPFRKNPQQVSDTDLAALLLQAQGYLSASPAEVPDAAKVQELISRIRTEQLRRGSDTPGSESDTSGGSGTEDARQRYTKLKEESDIFRKDPWSLSDSALGALELQAKALEGTLPEKQAAKVRQLLEGIAGARQERVQLAGYRTSLAQLLSDNKAVLTAKNLAATLRLGPLEALLKELQGLRESVSSMAA